MTIPIVRCRICREDTLVEALDLGIQFLTGVFRKRSVDDRQFGCRVTPQLFRPTYRITSPSDALVTGLPASLPS